MYISPPSPGGTDIGAYLGYLEQRGRKRTSIQAYRTALRRTEDYLRMNGMPTDPSEIGDREMLALAFRRDISEQTARYYAERYDDYIEWATGRTILPRLKIRWNRPVRKRRFMAREDLPRLLDAASPPQRMVIVLGAYMGLRRSEMTGILLDDIGRDEIIIRGKGHGDGLVVPQYMPIQVREELDRYLAWRAQRVGPDRRELLIGGDDAHITKGRLSSDTIYTWIKDLGASIGIDITPHSLRRLYCTTLYNHGRGTDGAGADIRSIITLTRHANVDVFMQCYVE